LLRAANEAHRAALDSEWLRRTKPVHVGWFFELMIARAEGEIAWCERIASLLEAGVPVLPGEASGAEAGAEGR